MARLHNWRFTHARLPVEAALLDSPDGWPVLDMALDRCLRAGLGCVLALQWPQTGLFSDEAHWQLFLNWWESIAGRYAGWPDTLSFELLDVPAPPDHVPETALAALGAPRLSRVAATRPALPGATGGRAWNALAQRTVQAIRTVDGNRPLIIPAAHGDAAGFAHLRPVRDAHATYCFQCFEPRAFTQQPLHTSGLADTPGTAGTVDATSTTPVSYPGIVDGERWDRSRLQRVLEPVFVFQHTYEVPVYLSAFGVSNGAPRSSQLTWLRSLLGLCRTSGAGWAYWAYEASFHGLICESGPDAGLTQYQNPSRLDYDLLGVLQSEA